MNARQTTPAECADGLAEVPQNNLLNEKAAADLLNCSVAFLQRCRLLARGPAYIKIGRLVRYSLQDLSQYVAACTKRVAA